MADSFGRDTSKFGCYTRQAKAEYSLCRVMRFIGLVWFSLVCSFGSLVDRMHLVYSFGFGFGFGAVWFHLVLMHW